METQNSQISQKYSHFSLKSEKNINKIRDLEGFKNLQGLNFRYDK